MLLMRFLFKEDKNKLAIEISKENNLELNHLIKRAGSLVKKYYTTTKILI